jgi:WD40 repeat protein/tetratricopeptide (TPR) repeat protein
MGAMACPSPGLLSAFVLGELPESELCRIAEHLDRCAHCDERAGRLDGAADAVLAGVRLIGDVGLGPVDDCQTEGLGERSSLPSAGETWGDFRIAREIGRGGMGVVCEAYQGSLNRHVAVKFLPECGDPARFRREARAAGRLHHTNIVPVFGVGEHQGRAYYVMQYIDGRPLDAVLRGRAGGAAGDGDAPGRFGDREAATIAVQVADALAYAHEQGVIHRDIKPSNLLLDDRGTAWVTDFGLAYDACETQTLTDTGDFLGTLRYLAPERLVGRGDARSDVYGLGATLYELVCGRPAYDEGDRAVLMHRILQADPPRPRQVDPRIARDLETIVLKAMARDPGHRYATARALAEDLRRFLEDRPILARRAGPLSRAARWCRRNREVAALLAGLVLMFLAGFVGVTIQWRRADAEATRANRTAKAEAEARAAEAELRLRARAEIASRDLDRGLELARKGDVDEGLLWMAEALAEAPSERPDFARMVQTNLVAWEGRVLRRRAILEHPAGVYHARFSPDGRAILTHAEEKVARLWDTATGRPLVPPLEHPDEVVCLAFSPDGRLAATGCRDGKVRIWDASTGRPAGPTLTHSPKAEPSIPVAWLEFSPDGRLLLSRDFYQASRLWEVATGREIGLPEEADTFRAALGSLNARAGLVTLDNTNRVAYLAPDGGHLLLLDREERRVRTCDLARRSLDGPPIRGEGLGWAGFSPDGRLIGTGDRGGTARLWDAATGRAVASFPTAGGGFDGATFSPDGRRLLIMLTDYTAQVWDIAQAGPVGAPLRHVDRINVGAFSPDGRLLVTASFDGTARLWDAATGRPIGSPLRHGHRVWDASFSPDGRLLVTASLDGTAQLWEIGPGALAPCDEAPAGLRRTSGAVPDPENDRATYHANADRDGSHVLLGGPRAARIVETEAGQPIGRPMTQRWANNAAVAISPDGRRIATISFDREPWNDKGDGSWWSLCQVWDAANGRTVSLLPHLQRLRALAFSLDGQVLATGDEGGTIHLWNAVTGENIGKSFTAGAIVLSLAFSPDGRLLAVGTDSVAFQALLWDLDAGRARGDPVRFKDRVPCLTFSPDGTDLAAGSRDGSVRVVETSTGRVRAELHHGGTLRSITFSPDGRLILTNGGSGGLGQARIWAARTGAPASSVLIHPSESEIPSAFTPDGTAFAIGYRDGSVRLWDVATGRPIGASVTLRHEIRALAFRPDGRSLLAVDVRGNVRTWPAPRPAAGPTDRLIRWIRVRTGRELDSGHSAALLAPEDWERLRAEAGDAPLMPDATDEAGWHEANARDAEAMGDGFGACWHLDRLIAARPDDGLLRARRARARLQAGDVASAEADIERAITLGPRDRILDWLDYRAEDFLTDGRPADALRLLDRVVAARPHDWLTYAFRAEAFAALGRAADCEADLARAVERGAEVPFLIRIAAEWGRAGRWSESAAVYDRAIATGTVPFEVWTQAAIAHLEIDDEDGFRRVCRALRDRHPAAMDEPDVGSTLAGVLILGPGGVGDDGKALGWIEPPPSAVDPARAASRRGCMRALGAVLYRLGRYREAIDRLREGIAAAEGDVAPEEAIFLAMAHFRTGDRARARALLARPLGDESDGMPAEFWWAARAHRLLRREAERLILDPRFPPDPFTP